MGETGTCREQSTTGNEHGTDVPNVTLVARTLCRVVGCQGSQQP